MKCFWVDKCEILKSLSARKWIHAKIIRIRLLPHCDFYIYVFDGFWKGFRNNRDFYWPISYFYQILELESDLDTEGRKSAEIVKGARKADARVREMQMQIDDERKANERTSDAAEKLNAKLKKMRLQLEEAVSFFSIWYTLMTNWLFCQGEIDHQLSFIIFIIY